MPVDSEPEYTYVRGAGWVIQDTPECVCEIVDLRTTFGPYEFEYQHRNDMYKPLWGRIRSIMTRYVYSNLEDAIQAANRDEVAVDAKRVGWQYRIAIVDKHE